MTFREIVDVLKREGGRSAVLATVVATEGSVYRRPGARLLVTDDGRSIGSISGGCLEADVLERAGRLAPGECAVVTYDTRSETDVVWGLGLGCNGVVTVLVERVTGPTVPLLFLDRCHERGEACVLATVYGASLRGCCEIGACLAVSNDDAEVRGTWSAALRDRALEASRRALEERRSRTLVADGASIFVEVLTPPAPLVVFGAGQDAVPLVRLGSKLGWPVTVVDWRPAFATRERFPEANEVVLVRPEDAGTRLRVDSRAAAVLVTHNYLADLQLLEWLAGTPVSYVALLGPRRRAERLLGDLGPERAGALRRRLHAPAGLDIGAETPEEIALAIVAEIRAARAGRAAGFLRDRRGAIHAVAGSR